MTGRAFNNTIAITGIGLQSCMGGEATQLALAIRANIQRIIAHRSYRWLGCPEDADEDDIPYIGVCPVPTLDKLTDGQERMFQLAVPALEKLVGSGAFMPDMCANAGFFLALPEGDEVIRSWPFDDDFVGEIVDRAGLDKFKFAKFNQFGSTGVFHAVGEAAQYLSAGHLEQCIVGGLDSFLLEERLELLDQKWRLKSPRNVDGFTPGEGAVMLVLETLEHAQKRGATVIATIDAMGFGIEEQTIASDKSSTAAGLTEAIRGVMEAKQVGDDYVFDYVYCDLNGESYTAEEWGLVLSRLGIQFDETKRLTHHASSCGDVGAATGGVLIANAAAALQKNLQTSDEALLWASADNGQRMAMTLRKFDV